MMKYVEDYSVSTLIVKDLSRLGREYSYMGRLQDFIFPAYDVRFIAINDDVDSAKGENDFAVFKNVFNDYYALQEQYRFLPNPLYSRGYAL